MKLEYFGHSCFRLTFSCGTRVVTDPFGDIGYPMPAVAAEIVTVSHGHYDHCNVGAVRGDPVIFRGLDARTVGGVEVSAVPCFHDEVRGAKRGNNLAFSFRADGLTVCHLGDIGEPCGARLAEKLRGADILLVPVGGHYTVGAEEAARYVRMLAPKIAIPMHYYTAGLQVDVGGAERFLSLFGADQVVRCGGAVELTRDSVASQNQKIMFMERIADGS